MIIFSGAVIFLACHSVYGQSRGPYDYVESAAVFNQYLSDSEYEIDSPAFRKPTLQFTTQIESLAFIYNLEQSTSILKTEVLGTSQDGQALMLLKFTRNNSQLPKPKILIVGQQHGDEPAGGEATLAFAAELAKNSSLLDKVDVFIVPRANPDGAERDERGLTNGDNVNRDHLVLQSPEGQC